MYWLTALATLSALAIIAVGLRLHLRPPVMGPRNARWLLASLAAHALVFFGAVAGALSLGLRAALAAEPAAEAARQVSNGLGLALIGAGIPTGLACVGAGIAVGSVGAAALAVIAEKPEAFGRTLVFLGLAEGIAIYGLVVTILMLGRI